MNPLNTATYEITNWVKAYTNEMLSYALSKTNHKETAEDIVHDTFLAAMESYEKFEGGSNPKTWFVCNIKK